MLKKTIAFGLVVGSFLLPISTFGAVEISDGSVKALYHLEDAVDASGNGYNLSNYQSVGFTSGILGNGADYLTTTNNNGSGAYQDYKQLVTRGFNLSASSNWTISTWFKPNDVVAGTNYDEGNNIFSLGNNTNKNEFLVGNISNKIGVNMLAVGVSASEAQANYTFTNGTWYLMTVIKNGTAMSLYINGAFVVAATDAVTDGSACGADCAINGLLIGAVGVNNADNYSTRHADTMFDEFVVTTSVISSSTLSALYNAGAGDEVCVTVGCGNTVTPTSTDSFCDSEICQQNEEYLFIGLVALLFGGGVYLGYRLILKR